MNNARKTRARFIWKWLGVLVNFLICLIILAAAVGAVIWINQTEPVAQKVKSTRKSKALVQTQTMKRGTYSPRITVLGTVSSAQQITLQPRVEGQVMMISDKLMPGGMVDKGDLLVQIDPADFKNALSIRKSELAQAEASMEIEKARQEMAKKELKLLKGSLGATNRSLVTREPQIASMKAQVSAASAEVQGAQINLERTQIYAPFDAQVLSRAVNVGSQVSTDDELGQLIGLEQFWIIAAVPIRSLRWIEFPKQYEASGSANAREKTSENDQKMEKVTDASKVILRNRDAWGDDTSREARVSKLIGSLDQQSRLARVLITVDDPLSLNSEAPPLILQTLLTTEIIGKPIEDVVRLERRYVRDRNTVWVMVDDKLEIREAKIEFQDAKYAYIRSGLEDGDEVVITTLATVAPGVGLRKVDPDNKNATETDEDEALDEAKSIKADVE